MVKVRLQGTTCEIKRMKRCIERNKRIKVISVSDAFPNKGTKKYFRQYMDVVIDPNGEKSSDHRPGPTRVAFVRSWYKE